MPVSATRGKLGLWSVLLAVAAFALMCSSVWIFAAITNEDTPAPGRTASAAFVIVAFGIPLILHIVGLGVAIAALFRPHERRGLAIAGLVINGLVVLGESIFLWAFYGTQ